MSASNEVGQGRTGLKFADSVSERFAFLGDLGFSEIESLPTIVRYQQGELEIDIYHGRQSYEVGFGITRHGVRYTISELVRAADPDAAARYRNYAATTPDGVAEGLTRLAELVRRYGRRALRDDPRFFATLDKQKKSWREEYALDVLAGQLRPKADAAFRNRDYREAAELYEKIRPRLTATELKKLALAKERSRYKPSARQDWS
jgi:hypothetical protein